MALLWWFGSNAICCHFSFARSNPNPHVTIHSQLTNPFQILIIPFRILLSKRLKCYLHLIINNCRTMLETHVRIASEEKHLFDPHTASHRIAYNVLHSDERQTPAIHNNFRAFHIIKLRAIWKYTLVCLMRTTKLTHFFPLNFKYSRWIGLHSLNNN